MEFYNARASLPPLAPCHTRTQSIMQRGDDRSVCETGKFRYTQQVQRHTLEADINTIMKEGGLCYSTFFTQPLLQNTHKRPAIKHRLAGLVSLSWLRPQVCMQVCFSVPVYLACVYACKMRIQGSKNLVIDFLMSVITVRKASRFQLTAQPSTGT